jgi:hypothetical protein
MKRLIVIVIMLTVASCKRCYEVRTSVVTDNSNPVVVISEQCGLTKKQAEQLRLSLTYTIVTPTSTTTQRAWVTPK